jgi:Domain of unknown function (DUF4389)
MNTHPVRLNVTDDLQRSRLTVFFRLLLAIPHWIVVALWGIVVYFAAILMWIATLIGGTPPAGLWRFIASFLRYSTQVNAYSFLVANPYPAFGGGEYPIDLEIDGPARQNRWITGFRSILAIPALLVASVLGQVLQIVAFLGWFVCLFMGMMPEGMRNLLVYCVRYQAQSYAYLLILTDRYPSFSSGQPDAVEAPAVPTA